MMTPLVYSETNATPRVEFDLEKNIFVISGCSRPEDVRDFYHPILRWLTEFIESVDDAVRERFVSSPLSFQFTFDYFNSSSAKFILDILVLINQLHQKGLNVEIIWYYDENDDDMKEVGEELSEVVDFQFQYRVV